MGKEAEHMINILVADDEQIERAVVCKALSRRIRGENRIFQAENGREAVEIFRREGIDVAILDVEMPGMNGIEAAETIRETDADCSILFLTAYDEFAYAKKAISVRALDYLLKPYSEDELVASVKEAIRTVMKHRQTRRELEKHYADSAHHAEGGTSAADAGQESDRIQAMRQRFAAYLSENYMKEISMQEVARDMNYSEAYFSRLFKQCFDQNFITYLTAYRVEEAKRLLREPAANVKEVGRSVGYADPNYFAKVFKRVTGQSPSEYRQNAR